MGGGRGMGVRTIDPRAHDSRLFVGAISRVVRRTTRSGSAAPMKWRSPIRGVLPGDPPRLVRASQSRKLHRDQVHKSTTVCHVDFDHGKSQRRCWRTREGNKPNTSIQRAVSQTRLLRAATSAPARLREARVAPMPLPTGAAEERRSPPREARGAPHAPPPSASSGNPLASVARASRAGTQVKRLGRKPGGHHLRAPTAGSRARTKEDGATLVGTVPDRTRDGATRTTANGMARHRSVLTLRARTRKRRKPRQALACRDRVTWTSARWTHATSWTLEHTSRTLRIPRRYVNVWQATPAVAPAVAAATRRARAFTMPRRASYDGALRRRRSGSTHVVVPRRRAEVQARSLSNAKAP